jgi:hypothetical protein
MVTVARASQLPVQFAIQARVPCALGDVNLREARREHAGDSESEVAESLRAIKLSHWHSLPLNLGSGSSRRLSLRTGVSHFTDETTQT